MNAPRRKLRHNEFQQALNDIVQLGTLGKKPEDIEWVMKRLVDKAGELSYKLSQAKAQKAKEEREQNV
jgi:hypothetical protein